MVLGIFTQDNETLFMGVVILDGACLIIFKDANNIWKGNPVFAQNLLRFFLFSHS